MLGETILITVLVILTHIQGAIECCWWSPPQHDLLYIVQWTVSGIAHLQQKHGRGTQNVLY